MDKQLELIKFNEYLSHHVSDGTRKLYVDALSAWFSTLDGTEPTGDNAQRYIDLLAEGHSPSTVGIRGHAIMKWFKSNKKDVDFDLPSIAYPKPKYFDMEGIRKLLNACASQLERTLITVLFDTALRISELLNLRLSGIHYSTRTLTVTSKGGRVSDVNISSKALDELSEWIGVRGTASEKVFGELNYQAVRKIMIQIGARAGFDKASLHMLRHSRAVAMLKSKAPIYVVQQHLRHRTISTTMDIYGQFSTMDLKEQIPEW